MTVCRWVGFAIKRSTESNTITIYIPNQLAIISVSELCCTRICQDRRSTPTKTIKNIIYFWNETRCYETVKPWHSLIVKGINCLLLASYLFTNVFRISFVACQVSNYEVHGFPNLHRLKIGGYSREYSEWVGVRNM